MLRPMRYVGYAVAALLGLVILLVAGTIARRPHLGTGAGARARRGSAADRARPRRPRGARRRRAVAGARGRRRRDRARATRASRARTSSRWRASRRTSASAACGTVASCCGRSVSTISTCESRVAEARRCASCRSCPRSCRPARSTITLGPIELRRARLFYEDDRAALRVTAQGLGGSARPGAQATSVTIAADEITHRGRVGPRTASARSPPTCASRPPRSRSGSWPRAGRSVASPSPEPCAAPFDAPTLDLTGRGEVDLASLGRRLGVGVDAGGRGPGHRAPDGPGGRAPRDREASRSTSSGPARSRRDPWPRRSRSPMVSRRSPS